MLRLVWWVILARGHQVQGAAAVATAQSTREGATDKQKVRGSAAVSCQAPPTFCWRAPRCWGVRGRAAPLSFPLHQKDKRDGRKVTAGQAN